jgi:hypothetical protein
MAPPTTMMVMVAIVLNGRTGVDRGGGFTDGRYRRGNSGRDGSQQDGATAENSANKNSSQLVHKHSSKDSFMCPCRGTCSLFQARLGPFAEFPFRN